MAISPNTNFTTGQVLTATNANQWPRGIMAYTAKASNTGLTTTVADVGVSITFTAVANRYYKYTFYSPAADATTTTYLDLTLTGTDNISIGQLNTILFTGGFYAFSNMVIVRTETAGSVTRKIRGKVLAGSGTLYANMYLMVEDMGPA